MNENEAIEVLKNNFPKKCKMVGYRLVGGFDDIDSDFGKSLLMAIKALEEIQKYCSIGTVEELKELKESALNGLELAKIYAAIEMLKKYEAIGTLEECHAAMEKQRAMKPAEMYKYTGGGKGFKCGSCGRKNVFGDVCCSKCGQRVLYEGKEQVE